MTKSNIMKTANNLYLKFNIGSVNRLFGICILLFCKTLLASATDFSPILGFGQESFSFTIQDVQTYEIKFEPNISGVSRIGINAFGFGIGYSFRGGGKNLDPAKGSTDFFDLQLGYNTKQWGIDSFYQTYKGFYTSNTVAIQNFQNLSFTHYALTGRYALTSSEFSIGGLLDQSEDVTTTASKYYVVGGVRYHSMQTDKSLLQAENAGLNTELENLRKIKVTSLNLGLGAGKYWVSSNQLFFGALLDLVGTLGNYDYENTNAGTSAIYSSLSFNIKIGAGYSGDVWKSGIGLTGDTTTLKTPGSSFIKPSAARGLIYVRAKF